MGGRGSQPRPARLGQLLAGAKHGLQGRNWVTRFNYQWAIRLGIYRLTGTVKPTLAYASR